MCDVHLGSHSFDQVVIVIPADVCVFHYPQSLFISTEKKNKKNLYALLLYAKQLSCCHVTMEREREIGVRDCNSISHSLLEIEI